MRLEARFPKAAILEFYLNQMPYARQRRGVVQAARTYFDRDVHTLSQHEMLALAVMVRAPSRLDLLRSTTRIRRPLTQLATRLYAANLLTAAEYQQTLTHELHLSSPTLPVQTSHFLRYVRGLDLPAALLQQGQVRTTLDACLATACSGTSGRAVTRFAGSGCHGRRAPGRRSSYQRSPGVGQRRWQSDRHRDHAQATWLDAQTAPLCPRSGAWLDGGDAGRG